VADTAEGPRSEAGIVAATQGGPVTLPSLVADLSELGVRRGMVLLVHSSLGSLGWVAGGAVTVVLALEEAVGEEGTVVMPTHSSDLSNPARWQHPPVPEEWWEIIRAETPPYDRAMTPTRGMGAIPECFRTQEGVSRSAHPLTSFAARGKHAGRIVADHALDSMVGEGSPLARIYDLDGNVLLLGVGHANNTSLHLAEHRADFSGKKTVVDGAPIVVDGERRWVEIPDLDLEDDDFAQIGESFEAESDAITIGKVGQTTARLMPQRALVDYGRAWMERNR
jgi:aminoglycoside 3-N-acetyltransferase